MAGRVLVAGSHGGVIAAQYAALAGARALILNDAGIGKDRAGVAGLDWLDAIGMAAATVDCRSARIGDGRDMLARGVISHVNAGAARCGVAAGQACADAAARLERAPLSHRKPAPFAENRWRMAAGPPEVWAIDSLGKVLPEDAGRILVIGSHGALLGGRRESALQIAAVAVALNDAGVGADRAGIAHLPALGERGIAGATVDCMSARIGDGRSMWDTGVLSYLNAVAERLGARRGERVRDFAARVAVAHARRGAPKRDASGPA